MVTSKRFIHLIIGQNHLVQHNLKTVLLESTVQQLLFEWSHRRVSTTDSLIGCSEQPLGKIDEQLEPNSLMDL